MSDVNQFQTLLDLTEYINSNERPKEQFRASLLFLLSTLVIDPDDLNEAICEAFSKFEDEVLPVRAAKVSKLINGFK